MTHHPSTPPDPASASALKAALRGRTLALRDALDPEFRRSASVAVAEAAANLVLTLGRDRVGPGPVAGFWPIRSEIDPRPAMERIVAQGYALALPVVTPDGLVFRHYAPGDALERAGFGLSHPPASATEVRPSALLVPLAAFDATGHRIGYGAGYYDRSIARLSETGQLVTIGLGFEAQRIASVPARSHDRALNWIVTERQILGPFGVGQS
jgi:5-formyltetrahydrofolate cyclo-ligase